jgi:adenylate kinase family enzyme
MMILGPKASGKSKIAENLAERTNMTHINFDDFVKENEFSQEDDETVTMALIKKLSTELKPRVILENFPQNEFQAKFFIRNCKQPSNVFSLDCSKDVCQERMIEIGESSPKYVSSAILSQKIKAYYQTAKDLLPYVKANTPFVSINTDRSFDKVMDDINRHIEPCVIHIRPGANSNILRKEITEKLATLHSFVDLDINGLIRDENERKTAIGIEMHQMV